MAHRIDYSGDGTKARVTIDLDGASLDADANAIGSQWQTLKNVLTDIPGVLPKRGAITDAGANTTDINDASGVLAFYDDALTGGATYRPYVGVCDGGGGGLELFAQPAATSRTEMASSLAALPVSKCPTVGGWLVLAGTVTGGSFPGEATAPRLYGGTAATTAYNTGTVTVTTGSTTVAGSGTTWTSAMEGMVFYVNTDADYLAVYRVKKVVSTTSLRIDRPYAGSVTGAGKAYTLLLSIQMTMADATAFGSAASYPAFSVAASAWGRLVMANTREAGSTTANYSGSPEYPTRMRWTGVIGSDEGSGGAIGMFAIDSNGYLDLDTRYGKILVVAPAAGAVLAFQESGVTVLRGEPVFDGAGSLDISEIHPGVAINGGFAFESTPEGVFFFDKNVGPCVYDGSRVRRIGDKQVTKTMLPYGITAVGYYDGKVLFSGTTTAGIFVFDTATGQWSLQVPPAIVSCLIAGRVENGEDVVGLGSGTQVVNLANMFDNPGVAATDWDGTAFVVDIKTGKIGDAITHLRPERMYVTYRLTDLSTTNPYLTTTTTTGLPDTSASTRTHSNGATELIETTDVETKLLEINLDRDPMMQLRVLQVNGAGKLELYSIIVECSVEGEGASS